MPDLGQDPLNVNQTKLLNGHHQLDGLNGHHQLDGLVTHDMLAQGNISVMASPDYHPAGNNHRFGMYDKSIKK